MRLRIKQALLCLPLALPIVAAETDLRSAPEWTRKTKLLHADRVLGGFTNGQERVAVIVNLSPPAGLIWSADGNKAQWLRALRAANHAAQAQVLQTLAADEHKPRFRFDNQAGFSCEVTRKALDKLLDHPQVESVEPVQELQAHLAQGIPLMNALTTRSTYTGAGTAIAICDTGIDYNHPRLGGSGFPNNKVIGGYDFGDDDANPIPNGQAHGTSCAGIAAGDLGTVGDYIGGVAPAAKLYACKISFGTGGTAYSDAMVAAWDWCVTHQNDDPAHPIMVISTSFGGGRNYSACDGEDPAMTTAANNAAAAGITVLVSSGNDGYCDSISWPACISSVISVGAVYDASFGTYYPCVSSNSCAPKTAGGCSSGYYATDNTQADRVTSYANVASFLGMLAPANKCYTTDISGSSGYSTGDYFDGFGGTSAACPYAAGAVACLQHAARMITGNYLTPAEVRTHLEASGDPVTDPKSAITKPRVNLGNAIASINAPPQITQQPQPRTNGVGTTATFSVTATGTLPLNFQWLKGGGALTNGGNISGATTNTLTLTMATTNDAGNYRVIITNSAGAATSMVATLTVVLPPVILTQPVGVTNDPGTPVNFSVTATSSVPVGYRWYKGATALVNGGNISGATSNRLTLVNVQLADAGNYSVLVSNLGLGGSVTSGVAMLALTDGVQPAITLAFPANNATFTANPVIVRGAAQDNAAVAQVLVQLNGGAFVSAYLTNNPTPAAVGWSLPLNLAAGSNTVNVKSVDAWGNQSATTNRSFLFNLYSALTVEVVGSGSVSPVGLNGASLLVGKAYDLTAAPQASNVFSNWVGVVNGATNVLTENPKLTFFMASNLVLRATFVPNRFPGQAGKYNGLFWETSNRVAHASAGYFSLKVTTPSSKLPTFSGKVKVNGDSLPCSGMMDVHGTGVSKPILRKGKGTLTLKLQLGMDDTMSGSVSNDNIYLESAVAGDSAWLAILIGDRAVFNALTNPATQYAGTNTMVLPGAADGSVSPGGDGYGVVKVNRGGVVKLTGSLGDGAAMSQTVPLSKDGVWPLYVGLYQGIRGYTNTVWMVKTNKEYKGEVLGWVTVSNGGVGLSGVVEWIKTAVGSDPVYFYPGGFTNTVQLLGSGYAPVIPVMALTNGVVLLSGGNLNTPLTNGVLMSPVNVITVPTNEHVLSLKVTLGTGFLSGTFRHPGNGGRSAALRGVILQGQNAGRGYFRGTNQTGALRLQGD